MFTFDLGISGVDWTTLFSKLITVVSYPIVAFGFDKGFKIYVKDLIPDFKYLIQMLKVDILGLWVAGYDIFSFPGF
ncbi:hypothetical protein CR532_02490 [Candidatus Borreliella tachyglossi]|uniref:Uncharacterized protein n=1 Tax=Candidatus Borreliella tachyglossi TaxID=1964448 RepID=A0A2S1LX43_9SPIR|nr:hypothetical protein [Candidatus Borreliella tachyglossi]AWG42846.1 hypothetical protein CR532_02490 [Candidatus Borreliella tachyglossi]